MKQRYASLFFTAIWLVVLMIPALRTMLYVQVAGSELMQPAWSKKADTGFYQKLAAKYPDDVRVQAKAIANDTSYYGSDITKRKAITRQYAALIKKFPNEKWLAAGALRWTSGWLEDGRMEPNHYWATVGSPLRRLPTKRKNFTPAELAQAINMARHGQQLEPDNSFYDWALAQFLFAGHYDEAALKTLHEGSLKKYYDDHRKDDARALISVRQLARPLLTEEKLGLAWGGYLSFNWIQHVANLTADLAISAEDKGDHATALRIYSDLARIATTMPPSTTSDYYNYSSGLAALRIQNMAWEGVNRKLPPPQWGLTPDHAYPSQQAAQSDESNRTKLRAENFAAYASSHGRPNLAAEALRQGDAAAEFVRNSRRIFSEERPYGIPMQTLSDIATLFWASGALLPLLLVTLLIWAGLWLTVKDRKVSDGNTSRLDVIKSAVFCTVIVGVIIDAPFYLRIIGQSNWPVWWYSQGEDTDAILQQNLTVIVWLVTFAPVSLGALYCLFETARREISKPLVEHRLKEGWKRPAPAVRWVMAASLLASWLIYWFFYQTQPRNAPWMFWTNMLALALFFYPVITWAIQCSQWLQLMSQIYEAEKPQIGLSTKKTTPDKSTVSFRHRDFFPYLRSDAGLALTAVASWLLFVCTLLPPDEMKVQPLILTLYLLSIGLTLYGIGRFIFRLARFLWVIDRVRPLKEEARPQVIRRSLNWYRQTLGAMLLVSSVAYLVLSLASLPMRRQADEKLDALIMRDGIANRR